MYPIKVGFPVSISGRYGIQGMESLDGLRLWQSDTNSRGGIPLKDHRERFPVQLIYYDDESSEEKCIDITRKLINDIKVDILIGPYSSGLSMAIAPLTKTHKRIVWNYGGATDEITETGYKNFINAITPSSNYFCGIIDLFRKKLLSDKKIAVVFARDSGFSNKVKQGAVAHTLKNKFKIIELGYNSGKTDFSDIINQILKISPGLILGVGRTEDDINFAKSIIDIRGIDRSKVGLVAASINYFKEVLGDDCEGFLSTSQWEKGLNIEPDFGPAPSEFYNDYLNFYKKEPNYLAAQAYNIGLIIERCINETGKTDENLLFNTAMNLDIKTFYGRFKIDKETGIQTGHTMLVTQWNKGRKVLLA